MVGLICLRHPCIYCTFSDIPLDENWNFVEINSTSDLMALENPKQKKYKTQTNKNNKKPRNKNNWNLFKHKFPYFKKEKSVLKDSDKV